jgi:phytanoyl-CoA hydroxylase
MGISTEMDLDKLRAQYEQDGYFIARKAVDEGLIKEMEAHADWLLERYPDKNQGQLYDRVSDDPFYVRAVSDAGLLDIVEKFLGPHIALFATGYFMKSPGKGLVLWHQDGSYWPLDPMEVCTLWVAITESTPERGCMRVIPGTQHLDLKEMKERTDIDNLLNSEIDSSHVDESKAVDLILAPGDVSSHHQNIIHGSNANTSSEWRKTLLIRYIPVTTRVVNDSLPQTFLLRGEAVPGINEYLPWPEYIQGKDFPFRGCETWNEGFGNDRFQRG